MKKIIDFIMKWIIGSMLVIIFLPLIVILLLLALSSLIPRIENTFVFNIVIWVDKFAKGFKLPWTLKKKLYFVLVYFTSIALWVVIIWVIF